MASGIACSVRLGRFKWSRKGYREVMNGAATQSLVRRPAARVLDAVGPEYEMKQWQGRLAKGYLVRTATVEGRRSEARNNSLSKAIRSV